MTKHPTGYGWETKVVWHLFVGAPSQDPVRCGAWSPNGVHVTHVRESVTCKRCLRLMRKAPR